ncbi:MAG: Hdr menaquinol oxidoreductase integral membrane subunit [bacterium]|nr:MAG: Hdr menaquinol oxidoreductase integral membrane subunit [bacterium]
MAKESISYTTIDGNSSGYWGLVSVLGILSLGGAWASYNMYAHGHYSTGMSNQVPWGFPIAMAFYLIGLSAGSLVLSALSSVFGKKEFKMFSRLAALLAALLLVGSLMCIILDWGRPDRILVPFFYMNPRSMFSLNGILYSTYIAICVVYLWAMFAGKEKLVTVLGFVAVFWAVLVHSGTGAIVGLIGARELFHSPLLPPSFIAAALSSGTALMILVLLATFRCTDRKLDDALVHNLASYLKVFIIVVMYFIFIENITRSYFPAAYEAQRFLLLDGNKYTWIFWLGMVGCGNVFPFLILLNRPTGKSIPWIIFACFLVVIGVLAERYIIVIPGQVLPLDIMPGYELSSAFNDGVIADYSVSFVEALQGLGIMSFVFLLYVFSLKFLELMPDKGGVSEEN